MISTLSCTFRLLAQANRFRPCAFSVPVPAHAVDSGQTFMTMPESGLSHHPELRQATDETPLNLVCPVCDLMRNRFAAWCRQFRLR
jgi:hypothetical protein